MIGQGVSSRSSHSAAAGRMTPAANPCTQSRMSRWSSESSSENAAVCCSVSVVDMVFRLEEAYRGAVRHGDHERSLCGLAAASAAAAAQSSAWLVVACVSSS